MESNEQANPQREPTFHEMKVEQLRQEREGSQPEAELQVEALSEEDIQAAAEAVSDASQSEEAEVEEPEGQPEAEATEEAEPQSDDSESDPEDADPEDTVEHWRAEAERANELRANMERDYRKKTADIGKTRRDLEEAAELNENYGQFFNNLAERVLAQFENVNWTEAKKDPESYMALNQRFQQAQADRDGIVQAMNEIKANREAAKKKASEQEANLSRDILRNSVPDWGADRYARLREFAVSELGYEAEEFDAITDWRIMAMAVKVQDAAEAPKVVTKKFGKRKAKAPKPQGRGKMPERNAKGQFQKSKDAWLGNPGRGEHSLDYFRQKLARETQGGG